MTNPTPHGQVPEALRLAHIFDNPLPPEWPDMVAAAAELRHQHTRIAELEAQIEALSGVQALSAAPEAIAKLRHLYQNMVNGAVRDTASAKRIAEGLLAPAIEALERATPPAEQQAAPKAAPTRTALPEGWTDCTIEFGNDGPEVVAYGPKRMMTRLAKWLGKYFAQVIAEAAPEAAPGEQNTVPAEWLEQAYREGWAACRDAETIGEEAEDWAFGNSTANSRMIDAQQAAPQQEAQEPVAYVHVPHYTVEGKVRPVVSFEKYQQDYADGIYSTRIPLYTAPQPAPAPLSDDVVRDAARYRWLRATTNYVTSNGKRIDVRNMPEKWDAAIDAALAAQGGE